MAQADPPWSKPHRGGSRARPGPRLLRRGRCLHSGPRRWGPLLVLWPPLTLTAFAVLPHFRRFWRGGGTRAPTWWSWSLAGVVGYLLIYSAGTFFAQHHLTGTDTPYVDMPYQLALIGELRHHCRPGAVCDRAGSRLSLVLLRRGRRDELGHGYRCLDVALSALDPPVLVVFVVLTAMGTAADGWLVDGAARRCPGTFRERRRTVRWTGAPVFDTQSLITIWTSPTNSSASPCSRQSSSS